MNLSEQRVKVLVGKHEFRISFSHPKASHKIPMALHSKSASLKVTTTVHLQESVLRP
jgi:hypothetical protein